MTDDPRNPENQPGPDDDLSDSPAPGRSVFGGDEPSFAEDDDAIPHWREPATGAVPMVGAPSPVSFDPSPEPQLSEAAPDELAAWSGVASGVGSGPDQGYGPAPVAGGGVGQGDAWSPEAFDPPAPVAIGADTADEFFGFDDDNPAMRPPRGPVPPVDPSGAGRAGGASAGGGSRDMPMAVVVGVGLAALILAALAVGPRVALAVVIVALGLAAVEFFNALRVAGYQPAVLLGLTSVVAMPLAAFAKGQEAVLLVLALAVVFGAVWYLTGVSEGAVRGLGATMIGVVQIGLLGSFAALMLDVETYGTGLLTAAIVLTVAYDVGGLLVGSLMGRTPLTAASPNKTMEGLIGGMAITLGTAIIMGGLGQPAPLANADTGGGVTTILVLGVAVALAAPVGDLAVSQMKRDLGIKDMGSLLPGHGGILDRLDGMLFAMPVTWYVSVALLG